MSHFLTTTAWSPDELDEFLQYVARMKAGAVPSRLDGKTMGMVFFNPSLRTRTSFETGMFQLGGHAVNLEVGQGLWKLETEDGTVMDGEAAEHIREAAPVLSRYVDVLGVRAFAPGKDWAKDRLDPVLSAFARYSEVPVINMESAVWHPCQALADALTWEEQGLKKGDKVVLAWAYHPKALPLAVPNSVLTIAAQRGLNVTCLRPEPFGLDPEIVETAQSVASKTGGSVAETEDRKALEGARIIYAKSWGSIAAYGKSEEEKALRTAYRDWQVTADWMKLTANAKFMHCLPVRRNVVVSDEVLDSAASVVTDQAENRLHVQKALLVRLLA